jgi:hypothetical protein
MSLKNKKLRPPRSQNESWRFIGLNCQGGSGLWESRGKQLYLGIRKWSQPPDAQRFMSLMRFEEIRRFFPEAFADADADALCSDPDQDSYNIDPLPLLKI